MIWVFPTAYKRTPCLHHTLHPKKLKNEQHPNRRVRVDEAGALEKSIDTPNLLVDELKRSMETTGGDA